MAKNTPAHVAQKNEKDNVKVKNKPLKALLVFLVIIAVIAGGLYLAAKIFIKPPVVIPDDNDSVPSGTSDRESGIYNIMLVGQDKISESTDTMIMVSVDTVNKKVNLLSIPRDTMANSDRSNKKINAAYSIGGEKQLQEEVAGVTGIKFDRYVLVDLAGFVKLVDAIGGIDIDVKMKMDYDDPAQNLHIHIKKGMQHLDGQTALEFVRFRHDYVDGNLGRVNAQKQFIDAVIKKVLSPSTIGKIPTLVDIANKNLKTDMSLTELLWFANQIKGMNSEDFDTHLLPGREGYYTKLAYYFVLEDETLELVNEFFNPNPKTPIKKLDLRYIDPKKITWN